MGTTKQDVARYAYRMSLRDQVIEFVYKKSEEDHLARISELAEENANKLGGVFPSFMYKEKLYVAWGVMPERGNRNALIHPDMLAAIAEVCDYEDFDKEMDRNSVLTFINNVFVHAKTTVDLKKMIPGKISQPIRDVNPSLFNEGYSLAEQDIQAFKRDNEPNYHSLRRLFLGQLLGIT